MNNIQDITKYIDKFITHACAVNINNVELNDLVPSFIEYESKKMMLIDFINYLEEYGETEQYMGVNLNIEEVFLKEDICESFLRDKFGK